jgi:hypothetical protein
MNPFPGAVMRTLLSWSLGFLLVTTSSCSMTPDEPEPVWRTLEVAAPTDHMVWQLTLLSLQNLGYPLASGTDSGAHQVETGWKMDMQPFRGEGQRVRAVVKMSPVERGRWKVEARVRREVNDNLVSPLDPTRAQWKPAEDDVGLANMILMHVRARLAPELEIQPEADPAADFVEKRGR